MRLLVLFDAAYTVAAQTVSKASNRDRGAKLHIHWQTNMIQLLHAAQQYSNIRKCRSEQKYHHLRYTLNIWMLKKLTHKNTLAYIIILSYDNQIIL